MASHSKIEVTKGNQQHAKKTRNMPKPMCNGINLERSLFMNGIFYSALLMDLGQKPHYWDRKQQQPMIIMISTENATENDKSMYVCTHQQSC